MYINDEQITIKMDVFLQYFMFVAYCFKLLQTYSLKLLTHTHTVFNENKILVKQ